MIKLKTRDEILYNALMICLVSECSKEAEKLWSTETNLIDVCKMHYDMLEAEKYIT
jgi:hypothetical protein